MSETKRRMGGEYRRLALRAGLQPLAAIAALCLSANGAPALAQELGTWLNAERKAKVKLSECGQQGLCSAIVWLKDPLDEKGNPWRDILNPDPTLRQRPVLGLDVLIGTKKVGPNTWQGQIYDPEVGKVYYLKHIKVGQDKVEIRGCLSSGWPCRTKYWTRSGPVSPPAAPAQVVKRPAAPAPQATAPAPVPQASAPAPVTAPPQAQAPSPPSQPQARAPVSPRQAAPPRPPEMTAALPNANSGGYLVQIAARQSHNEAMAAFNDLQRRYPQLLGGLRPEVLKADLGRRGVWYRVGVGPLEQQSAAVDFCQRLKAVGADCLIRRF